jgi:TRAP-type transport system periplasmic protein
MMKRKWLLTIGVMLVLLLVTSFFTSCSSSAPASPTTPPATTTSAQATTQAAAKPIALRASVWVTDVKSAESESIKWWADEIQKRTNGKVKITLYFGETLVKNMEDLPAVRTGTVDLDWLTRGYFPNELPLSTVGDGAVKFHYAFGPAAIMAFWQILQEFPAIQAEYTAQNVKPLISLGIGSASIMSNKMIQSVADMKGIKIRGAGAIFPKLLESSGAIPVSMAAPELYDALSKGILDATTCDLSTANHFKLSEVVKYRIMIEFGAVPSVMLCANLDIWNKLPADVQKVMTDIRPEFFDVWAKIHYSEMSDIEAAFKKNGMQFIPFPAAEAEKWKTSDGVLKLKDQWTADMNKKGLPGQAVMDRWLGLEQEMETTYGLNGTHWR